MEPPFPAYKGDEPYIFVSYSHEDTEIAFPGVQWLRDQGFNIWYDEGISPGASWREEIAESILGCDLFIIIISPRSAHSDNCLKEVNYALEQGRPILAIHIESTQLSPGLALALSDRQAILRHEITQEQYRDKILSGVRGHIQQSSSFAPTVSTTIANKNSWPMVISAGVVTLAILVVGFLLYTKPSEEIVDSAPSTGVEAQSEASVANPSIETRPEVLHNSIAVLPFVNLSPDPNNAYFALGVHEEILNQLSKIRDLSVIARTSVMQYAGVSRPVSEIAAELNVTTVMEGSVRYAGSRVRITTQLIDARTGVHLWSETYDRELTDIFEIESDIATNIAEAMRVEFSVAERANVSKAPTENLEAYTHYLKAMALMSQQLQLEYKPVFKELDLAIGLDPNFSVALAAQSYFHATANVTLGDQVITPEEQKRNTELAEEYAGRALSIDPNSAMAYVALSVISQINRAWADRLKYTRRAIEISPNNLIVLFARAQVLLDEGHIDEAIPLFEKSQAMDPRNTLVSYFASLQLANVQRWAAARNWTSRFLTTTPDSDLGYSQLAMWYLLEGNREEARIALEKADQRIDIESILKAPNDFNMSRIIRITHMHRLLGNTKMSESYALVLDQIESENTFGNGTAAFRHLAVGEVERSADFFLKLVETNFPAGLPVMLKFHSDNPMFDSVREQPKFQQALKLLGVE